MRVRETFPVFWWLLVTFCRTYLMLFLVFLFNITDFLILPYKVEHIRVGAKCLESSYPFKVEEAADSVHKHTCSNEGKKSSLAH